MSVRSLLLILATISVVFAVPSLQPVAAAEPQIASLQPAPVRAGDLVRRLRGETNQKTVQAGCGLCTNVDCCGGASNGWKLCKSNCRSGYKCMQVATCP